MRSEKVVACASGSRWVAASAAIADTRCIIGAQAARIIAAMPEQPEHAGPESVAAQKQALSEVGYLADEPAALVSYLAQRLGKPVLVEGPAGLGKTELAQAISRASGRELIRLQCYARSEER